MPSRNLFKAIAAPAVLTLASVAPVLGTSQASTASAAAAPAEAPRPNLVFIMADDLGWADLSTGLTNGGYGNDYNETPRIDQLAEEGQVFTEAYASVQCSPTRTALHTGQYATRPTNNVYAVGAVTGSATSPLRGRDPGPTRRGRQDRRPGGLHDDRRDPAERRLHHRLLGQVPRHRLGRRDRDQPRVRRELGRQPELPRHLLLRDRTTSSTTRSHRPWTSSPATTPRSTSTRTSRRTATASATRSSTPSSAPTSTSPTRRPTRRSTSSTAARTSRSSRG